MERKVKIFLAVAALCMIFSGCGNKNAGTGRDAVLKSEESPNNHGIEICDGNASEKKSDVMEIKEHMFIAQIDDIYCNFESYRKKKIAVEGMYFAFTSSDGREKMPGVWRKSPGCCGNDGWSGFFIKHKGKLPEENEWIRVIGTPETSTSKDGFTSLYLKVTSIKVKSERGEEFVTQ